MLKLNFDFETYCDLDITKVGAYKYASHPSCEILMCSYNIGGQTQLWDATKNKKIPATLLRALKNPKCVIHAFNAPFERLICKHVLGIDIPIERFRCTMVHAYSLSFVGGLGQVGESLGIDKRKLEEGKELIKLFCQPRKPTKNKPWSRTLPEHEPEKWEEFRNYCIRDTDAEMLIEEILSAHPMSDEEWDAWFMDQEINDRGLPMDRELIEAAIQVANYEREIVLSEIEKITKVENPNSKTQVRQWLNDAGCDIPNMQKLTLEEYSEKKYRKRSVKRVIELLLRISRSSYTKYTKMLEVMLDDDRIYGTLQFLGAQRTGRWAGRLIQPQNFVRPPKGFDPADSISRVLSQDLNDDIMEHLATALRGTIAAPDGELLTVADLAGIEGRVLPWLCFFESKLNQIRSGLDMYIVSYLDMYGGYYDAIDDAQRFIGKVAELALGFQGSINALNNMASTLGAPPFEEEEAQRIVNAWRRTNKPIQDFWYDTQDAAKAAIRRPGERFISGRLVFEFDGGFLKMYLPSGRPLYYFLPEVDDNGRLSYMGWNSYKRKWERIDTYGGKIVENGTQAVAREVLVYGMKLARQRGFNLVGSIHDEPLTCQKPTEMHGVDALVECLTTNPPWAEGLPLAAKGYRERRFKKD